MCRSGSTTRSCWACPGGTSSLRIWSLRSETCASNPSPMNGLDFCKGCGSERQGGAGVLDAIRWFGGRGRILYVHLRDVQGCADNFQECFVDEGNCDVAAVIRTLREVGFRGFIL